MKNFFVVLTITSLFSLVSLAQSTNRCVKPKKISTVIEHALQITGPNQFVIVYKPWERYGPSEFHDFRITKDRNLLVVCNDGTDNSFVLKVKNWGLEKPICNASSQDGCSHFELYGVSASNRKVLHSLKVRSAKIDEKYVDRIQAVDSNGNPLCGYVEKRHVAPVITFMVGEAAVTIDHAAGTITKGTNTSPVVCNSALYAVDAFN